MNTETRPLMAEHIAAAARLLAERHRIDRTRTPALSPRFEDSGAARSQIEAGLADPLARGVVAIRGDAVVGFLIGKVSLPSTAWHGGYRPRRAGTVVYAGYAAIGPAATETYRQLYAALALFFIDHGAFLHEIEINAADDAALRAWVSLGFGQTLTLAARDTTPLDGAASVDIEIDRAGPEDIDIIMKLGDDLARHHNTAPIFLPYIPEETNGGFRGYELELLQKPENAHWVAYRDGRPAGMQTFHEQDFAEMARPDRSVYLFFGVTAPEARGGGLGTAILRHAMKWAREEGYERCTLHFLSANITGARFWLGSGFQPLTMQMERQVDDRLGWARAGDA
ncbi:MAG: GNAT family N-acetyltransferase [Dehalococcoidia bacterium]